MIRISLQQHQVYTHVGRAILLLFLFACESQLKISTSTIGANSATSGAAVTAVSSTNEDGTYGSGDEIRFAVHFSKDVVLSGSGELTLLMNTGNTSGAAIYYREDNTNPSDTLVFSYIVQPTDSSDHLQYAGVNALVLDGTLNLKDQNGRDARLTLPELASKNSLGSLKNIVIQGAKVGGSKNIAAGDKRFEDNKIHFEKLYYQSRSIKRLVIKTDQVAGIVQTPVSINTKSVTCNINPGYSSPFLSRAAGLSSLEFVNPDTVTGVLGLIGYGSEKPVTVKLAGAGVVASRTTEGITLKDFSVFGIATTGFAGNVQVVDGFQGWAGAMSGSVVVGGTMMSAGLPDMIHQ